MNLLLDTPAPSGSTDAAGAASRLHGDAVTPSPGPRVRLITSAQLLAGFPEVQIVHGDAIYRLRQTSLGKLILTK